MGELGLDDRQGSPPLLEPLIEGASTGDGEEIHLDRAADLGIGSGRLRDHRLDPGDVPAVLGLTRPDDRPDLSREQGVLEGTGELASTDVAEVAAVLPAAGIGRDPASDVLHRLARFEPAGDVTRGACICHEDVADTTNLRPAIEIRIPKVVVPDLALWNGHGAGNAIHEPGERRPRWPWRPRPIALAVTTGGRGLLGQDLLGHELLDDPPPDVDRRRTAIRREVPPARPPAHFRKAGIKTRHGDRPATDRGHERGVAATIGESLSVAPRGARQPLTPTTVIPSTKKRWARRNNTITGKTISVEAAISRL